MGIGLSMTTVLVWFFIVFVFPLIYIMFTLRYKQKMYSIYEHFLAIGMIKTSLDYVYDEVKEWHITRDKFNETFVTALYKQIKSDYCNTFSGKDRVYIEEILKLYYITKRHQKWYFITIRKGITYDCYKIFDRYTDDLVVVKSLGGVLKNTTVKFTSEENEILSYYTKDVSERDKAADVPNVPSRVVEKSLKIEESIYGAKPKKAKAATIENEKTEDLTISLIDKYKVQ